MVKLKNHHTDQIIILCQQWWSEYKLCESQLLCIMTKTTAEKAKNDTCLKTKKTKKTPKHFFPDTNTECHDWGKSDVGVVSWTIIAYVCMCVCVCVCVFLFLAFPTDKKIQTFLLFSINDRNVFFNREFTLKNKTKRGYSVS